MNINRTRPRNRPGKDTTINETVHQEPVTTAAGVQQEPRTFTQDEVNSIIADRLTRERAKYADYDDLKAKAQQFDTTKAQLDALNAANAQRDMKARVSAATGVPVELLTADTEEACTAQAQAIAAYAKPVNRYPVIHDGGELPYDRAPSLPGATIAADAFSRDKKHIPKPYPNY